MWKSIKPIIVFFGVQFVLVIPAVFVSMIAEINETNSFFVGLIISDLVLILYFRYAWNIRITSGELYRHPFPTTSLCICMAPFLSAIAAALVVWLDLPNTVNLHIADVPVPLAFAAIGVLGPVAEEMAFRGGVLGSLLKWEKIEGKPWAAILISALLFSIAHLNPAQAPVTFILGILAGWLYFRTESLIPGMLLHVLNNSLVCAIIAIPEDSYLYGALEEWNPSTASLLILLAGALTLIIVISFLLVNVINRDMPPKSIWSSTDPDACLDKNTAGKLGICAGILVIVITLLSVVHSARQGTEENLFDSFGDFHEGLAKIKVDGKIGFIDRDGNVAIPCLYDSASDRGFSDGLCCVEKDGMSGYIDKNGDVAVSLDFSKTGQFCEGMAWVCKEGKYGYIDKDGQITIPFEYARASDFKDGMAAVVVDKKSGIIDRTGQIITPFEYDDIYPFHDGLAMVSKDGSYGFIDIHGKLAVPIEYSSASLFKNGLSIVSKDHKYGGIDTAGIVVIPMQYDYLRTFCDSLYLAGTGNGNLIINSKNEIVSSFGYQSAIWCSDGLAMVELDEEKSALVNFEGEIQRDFNYILLSGLNDGLAIATKSGKKGFVNSKGDIVVPFDYDDAAPFSCGLARVCKGKHRYYIDTKGEVIIELFR